jgi:FMN reductase
MSTILLLGGSPSVPSRSARLLDYVGGLLTAAGHAVGRLNVRDLPAAALLHADVDNAEIRAAQERVLLAQAVVVATPVYKAAYSGILKAFLDLLPQTGLTGKLVLPIATGGSPAHMLALDYALRPVLSALSARHVLPSVYATDKQIQFSQNDGLKLDADVEQRLAEGAQRLSESLKAIRNELLVRNRSASHPTVPFSQVRCSV